MVLAFGARGYWFESGPYNSARQNVVSLLRTLFVRIKKPLYDFLAKNKSFALQENSAVGRVDLGQGILVSLTTLPNKDWTSIPIDISDLDGGKSLLLAIAWQILCHTGYRHLEPF